MTQISILHWQKMLVCTHLCKQVGLSYRTESIQVVCNLRSAQVHVGGWAVWGQLVNIRWRGVSPDLRVVFSRLECGWIECWGWCHGPKPMWIQEHRAFLWPNKPEQIVEGVVTNSRQVRRRLSWSCICGVVFHGSVWGPEMAQIYSTEVGNKGGIEMISEGTVQ